MMTIEFVALGIIVVLVVALIVAGVKVHHYRTMGTQYLSSLARTLMLLEAIVTELEECDFAPSARKRHELRELCAEHRKEWDGEHQTTA